MLTPTMCRERGGRRGRQRRAGAGQVAKDAVRGGERIMATYPSADDGQRRGRDAEDRYVRYRLCSSAS
jgi:hypothetical protein